MSDIVKIKIAPDERHGGVVPLGINGKYFRLPVGKEIEVPDDILSALDDAEVVYEVVDGVDGVSTPSAAPEVDLAPIDPPAEEPVLQEPEVVTEPAPEVVEVAKVEEPVVDAPVEGDKPAE